MQKKMIWLSVALAFVLWYVMFVIRPLNFWLMMSISTSLLSLIALAFGSPFSAKGEWTWKNVVIGLFSALALYVIFWLGNQMLLVAERLAPSIFSAREANLAAIYGNRGSISPHVVALLLFFPIGFGEEFYWRGLVQKYFNAKMSRSKAFLLTTFLYTAVHFSTGNPVLVLAALTCGLFWGGLYAWRGSLLPVLISHMIWDPLIFIYFPIL